MNAGLQMLTSVPQFKNILNSIQINNAQNNNYGLIGNSLKNVVKDL